MHRRRVLDKSITYVGLDVHKDTIAVALTEAGAHKDVCEYGKIANTAAALNALAAKLSRAGSELVDVEIVLDQNDDLGGGKVDIGQVFQDVSIIHGGVAIGDFDSAPAFERREQHEEVGG
jgi:molybdopterin biosynthesis enzyme